MYTFDIMSMYIYIIQLSTTFLSCAWTSTLHKVIADLDEAESPELKHEPRAGLLLRTHHIECFFFFFARTPFFQVSSPIDLTTVW